MSLVLGLLLYSLITRFLFKNIAYGFAQFKSAHIKISAFAEISYRRLGNDVEIESALIALSVR